MKWVGVVANYNNGELNRIRWYFCFKGIEKFYINIERWMNMALLDTGSGTSLNEWDGH